MEIKDGSGKKKEFSKWETKTKTIRYSGICAIEKKRMAKKMNHLVDGVRKREKAARKEQFFFLHLRIMN